MSVFDSEILDIMRDTADISLKAVQDVGLLFAARHQVTLRNEILPSAQKKYGFTVSPTVDDRQFDDHVFNPQPIVDLRVQQRFIDGVVLNIGDAKLKNISQNDVTRKQLEDASYYLVGTDKYDLVRGTIKDSSSGIFWELILKRREQNDAP